MNQTNEAAQGATERQQFEAWFGRPLMNPAYPSHFNGKHARKQWEAWQARAALKAQPAPTEAAQGEDSARFDWLIENVSSGSIGFANGDFIGSQNFDELRSYIDTQLESLPSQKK